MNPASAEPLCEVASGTAADIDIAVASGRRAFAAGGWRYMAPRDRLEVLNRLAALIERNTDRFALLDTLAMGKPIRDMLAVDVPQSALTFRYFAELSDKVEGAVTATAVEAFHYTLREPLGVVGCIVPWNFPLMMTAWKIAPALAAGNSVVLKPAENSPLSALLLAELFVEAGGPAGVLNVVNGSGLEAGAPLALHNDVAKISFTGSTATGKKMLEYSARSNMKRVSLECGGKSPQVFLADLEDLDRAVTYAVNGIFLTAGESCSAGSRLLVDKRIAREFAARFIELGRDAYRAGDPLDPETNLGPLVSAKQHAKVLGYVATGRAEGAKLEFGGDVPDRPGYYVNPALFTQRAEQHEDRAGGDLRPGRGAHRGRRTRRCIAHRERHDLRSRRLGVDERSAYRARRGARSRGRRHLRELLRSRRPDPAFPGTQAVWPGRRQVPRGAC